MAYARTARYRARRESRHRSLAVSPAFAKQYASAARPSKSFGRASGTKAFALPRSFSMDMAAPFVYNRTPRRLSTGKFVFHATQPRASAPPSSLTQKLVRGSSLPSQASLICARRQIRKEVLIASGFRGGGKPHFSPNSRVRC